MRFLKPLKYQFLPLLVSEIYLIRNHLGTSHKVQGGWAGKNKGWVINFKADEKG